MPYGARRLVAVPLSLIPGLMYGFRTDVADATSTALGHVDALDASGNYIRGVAFGVNSPKPPKAKKFFGTGTKKFESSFVAPARIDPARADGWVVTPGKVGRARSTAFSKLVYVDHKLADPVDAAGTTAALEGIVVRYAWRMPLYQYNKLTATDKTTIGLSDASPDDVRTLLLGLNSPKPGRASKTITVDGRQQTITTFVSHNKRDSLANGWS